MGSYVIEIFHPEIADNVDLHQKIRMNYERVLMYKTVCARFRSMNAPTFPMAGLLVFWGGLQNGFWAFGHNPTEYAKKINCPTLLMYGQQDDKVSRAEIDEIFANLAGQKELKMNLFKFFWGSIIKGVPYQLKV